MRIDEIIRKLDNGKYRLYSKSGKNLGTYGSRAGAEKRERQVQYFKHAESIDNDMEEGNKAQKGIPANATLAQLDKIRSSKTASPAKKKRAHWLANMRRGQKKK